MEENEQLAALVEKVEKDKRSATELLDKSERERKRISEKNAQLTINGMKENITVYYHFFNLDCSFIYFYSFIYLFIYLFYFVKYIW